MTALILTIFIQGLGISPALFACDFAVLGTWRYDGFLYDGHRYPNPNPDLTLEFTFYSNGINRLYWTRKNEDGFCERLATHQVVGRRIIQKVTWINPKNAPECSRDVDMQLGRETEMEFSRPPGELWFHFDLNGKPFMYILKAILEDGSIQEQAPQ